MVHASSTDIELRAIAVSIEWMRDLGVSGAKCKIMVDRRAG